MNIKKFQFIIMEAKEMVNDKFNNEEIKNFFISNSINVTDKMVEDFVNNAYKL